MKIVVALTIFLNTVAAVAADGVSFFTPNNWHDAQQAAKTSGKYLFVDAYTDWCGWCKVMDNETFANADVAALMNSKFVSVKIDMERGFGVDVAMKYRVQSFPQFLIFTPNGKLVYRLYGYMPPDQFIPELNNALNEQTQMSFPGISAELNIGIPQFLRNAYGVGGNLNKLDQKEVDSWLNAHPDKTSEAAWTVIKTCITNTVWQDWVIKNRAALEAKYALEVPRHIERIIGIRMQTAIERNNKELFEKALAMLPDTDPNKPTISATMRTRFLIAQKEWVQAADMVSRSYSTSVMNAQMANEFAWSMYEECEDEQALERISSVMKLVVDAGAGWAEWDTFAALMFKLRRYSEALAAAKKALEMGNAQGADTKETQALIDNITYEQSKK